jgi:predicted nucleotidyltransferase
MQSIAQAFNTFLSKLELTSNEKDEASRQHTHMRTELQQRLTVEDNFLSGSYKRNTAVRPLNDIDIFVVLRENDSQSPELGPDALLDTIQSTLEDIYPGKTTTRQARSINVEFSGTGIAYDVVPSFFDEEHENAFIIPDGAGDWLSTNPKTHQAQSTEANENAGKLLKPLLKTVKHAKNVHDAPARSFHLEVMSWDILTEKPSRHIDGLVDLLDGLAARVCDPCPDPAGLGPDIRPSTDRCITAQRWLEDMAELARDARDLAADGKLGEAHFKLRELLGPEWPEKGKKPGGGLGSPAIISGAGGSVDDSRHRFG